MFARNLFGHRVKRLPWHLPSLGIVFTLTGLAMAEPQEEPQPVQRPEEAPGSISPSEDVPSSYIDWFREMMERSHKPFEFHGYLRTGFGINGKGGDQEMFQAPLATANYHLGNEVDTWGELVLVNNWLNPKRETELTWFRTQVLVTFSTTNNENFDAFGDLFLLREAYALAGNVFRSQPDIKVWTGLRYYRRHNIYINNFFYFSESGYGGGIEDIKAGIGKLAVAYLGNSEPPSQNGDVVDTEEFGRVVENNVEFRLYDVPLPAGIGLFAVKGSYSRGKNNGAHPDLTDVPGFLLTFVHTRGGFLGGFNQFSLQYGVGGSSDIEDPLNYRPPTEALKRSKELLVTNSTESNFGSNLAALGAALVRWRDNGDNTSDTWLSAGFRPVFRFSPYAALAAEAGVDVVRGNTPTSENLSGALFKFSIAPQVRAGSSFFSRPEIRAYATLAHWTEGFRGHVGGRAHTNDTFGLAFGVRAESWW